MFDRREVVPSDDHRFDKMCKGSSMVRHMTRSACTVLISPERYICSR